MPVALVAQELRVALVGLVARAAAAGRSPAALLDLVDQEDRAVLVAAAVVPEAALVVRPSRCSTLVRARLW